MLWSFMRLLFESRKCYSKLQCPQACSQFLDAFIYEWQVVLYSLTKSVRGQNGCSHKSEKMTKTPHFYRRTRNKTELSYSFLSLNQRQAIAGNAGAGQYTGPDFQTGMSCFDFLESCQLHQNGNDCYSSRFRLLFKVTGTYYGLIQNEHTDLGLLCDHMHVYMNIKFSFNFCMAI